MRIDKDYTIARPEYYKPLPDIGLALERIGLDPNGDYSPSKENLQKLILAHMMTVPYETLDNCDFIRTVDYFPEMLFERFVLHRRGGYCFEVNGFFMAILEGLGYDCYAVAGRLLFGRKVYSGMGHRNTVVKIDGRRYLTDLSFGNGICPEGPVDIDEPGIQDVNGEKFSVRHHEGDTFGDVTLVKHNLDGTETDCYCTYLYPQTLIEFINTNERVQLSFVNRRVCRLKTETGSLIVDGTKYRRTINGEVFEEDITSFPQFYKILTEDFNMVVPRISLSNSWPREIAYDREDFLKENPNWPGKVYKSS